MCNCEFWSQIFPAERLHDNHKFGWLQFEVSITTLLNKRIFYRPWSEGSKSFWNKILYHTIFLYSLGLTQLLNIPPLIVCQMTTTTNNSDRPCCYLYLVYNVYNSLKATIVLAIINKQENHSSTWWIWMLPYNILFFI